MSFDSGLAIRTRDRLRRKLDVIARYERVLREQLDALGQEDIERFDALSDEREVLGEHLVAADDDPTLPEGAGTDPFGGDLEAQRLMAEIHLRSSALRDLDDEVMGALAAQRNAVRAEIDTASRQVSDGAVRYLEAESGDDGSDRLDVVL